MALDQSLENEQSPLHDSEPLNAIQKTIPAQPKTAPLNRPAILAVENQQSLENALVNAFRPDEKTLGILKRSFQNIYVREKYLAESYSKKSKKNIYSWKYRNIRLDFNEGIYIVRLSKDLAIINANKISQVMLDPEKYQNQQYLNNSYFANKEKYKAL